MSDKPEPTAARFEQHVGAVSNFLTEMYATLVDPVEDAPATKVPDLCKLLLEAARNNREALNRALAINAEARALAEAVLSVHEYYYDLPIHRQAVADCDMCPLVVLARAVLAKLDGKEPR